MWEASHEVLRRWAITSWEARLRFREEMPEVSGDVRSLVEDGCLAGCYSYHRSYFFLSI